MTKRILRSADHMYRLGMTDGGRLVISADLLAQVGHRFGFRSIVEKELSHAMPQTEARVRAVAFALTALEKMLR
jgi:hypothetical protein